MRRQINFEISFDQVSDSDVAAKTVESIMSQFVAWSGSVNRPGGDGVCSDTGSMAFDAGSISWNVVN